MGLPPHIAAAPAGPAASRLPVYALVGNPNCGKTTLFNAITEEKIDEHAVENALKRAEQELRDAKNIDPAQYEHLQELIRYSGVQLGLKRRRR